MRARADTEVALAAPVGQIVARFMAGRRVVRNLVHRIAPARKFLAHQFDTSRPGRQYASWRDSPALQLGEKCGAFLKGQVVGRDMVRAERGGFGDIIAHVVDASVPARRKSSRD